MGLRSLVSKFRRPELPTLELVGEVTQWGIDPQGDGRSATFRLSSLPDVEFRQRPNTLSSAHRKGEQVKVVYSLVSPGVARVDYVQKV